MKKVILAIGIAAVITACGGQGNQSHESHDHSGHDGGGEKAKDKPRDESLDVPEGARVFFANLENGQEIESPFTIEFGVEGMTLAKAGASVKGEGHHHIFIDSEPVNTGEIVPMDNDNIKHYGNAQTSDEITLAPGKHKLALQLADGLHRSFGEKLYAEIEVTVKGGE